MKKRKIIIISIIVIFFIIIGVLTLTLDQKNKLDVQSDLNIISEIANELGIIPSEQIDNGLKSGEYYGEFLTDKSYNYTLKLIVNINGTYTASERNKDTGDLITQTGEYSLYDNNIILKSNNDKLGIDGSYVFKSYSSPESYVVSNEKCKFRQTLLKVVAPQ